MQQQNGSEGIGVTNGEVPNIRFEHSIGYMDEGLDTLIQPWFDITDKLPFPIPNDPDTSDVFFFALYSPDNDSMKYVCSVVIYGDDGGSNAHEFELTAQEIALLKDGMEALCQREHNCSLKAYWEAGQY